MNPDPIQVYVSTQEKAEIKQAAAESRRSVSAYLLWLHEQAQRDKGK